MRARLDIIEREGAMGIDEIVVKPIPVERAATIVHRELQEPLAGEELAD